MSTSLSTVTRARTSWLAKLLAWPGVELTARVAIVSAFVASGLSKLIDFPGAVAEVRVLTGLEPAAPVAALVIAVQLAGSTLVILGGRLTWLGAGLLGGFTIVATLLALAFWTKTGADRVNDLTTFFEHAGLVGGFALVSVLASGRPSGRAR